MKRKVGTVLDEEVVTRLKVVAASEGRALSAIIEEALRQYLATRNQTESSVVLASAGTLKISRRQLQQLLDLDPYED
jgi:plasmid stability protein